MGQSSGRLVIPVLRLSWDLSWELSVYLDLQEAVPFGRYIRITGMEAFRGYLGPSPHLRELLVSSLPPPHTLKSTFLFKRKEEGTANPGG